MAEEQLARDLEKAQRAVVAAAGGAKTVGPMVYPRRDPEDAEGLLNDCINRNHRCKFSLVEIVQLLAIGRESGCHDFMHALEKAAGYTTSRPASDRQTTMGTGEAIIPTLLAEMLEELRSINDKTSGIDNTLLRFEESVRKGGMI